MDGAGGVGRAGWQPLALVFTCSSNRNASAAATKAVARLRRLRPCLLLLERQLPPAVPALGAHAYAYAVRLWLRETVSISDAVHLLSLAPAMTSTDCTHFGPPGA
ncbi:hypothetical protein ABPG77_008154 [Micractinium sp. CCAP 211/92]